MTAVSDAAVLTGPRHREVGDPNVAAQLCWHTIAICRALDRGIGELQAALADAGEHADAILELALALADTGAAGRAPVAGVERRS